MAFNIWHGCHLTVKRTTKDTIKMPIDADIELWSNLFICWLTVVEWSIVCFALKDKKTELQKYANIKKNNGEM